MLNSKLTVLYENEEEFKKMHAELIEALYRYRYWVKFYNEYGGGPAREKVLKWGKKVDELLSSYGFTDHVEVRAVQVFTDREPPPK